MAAVRSIVAARCQRAGMGTLETCRHRSKPGDVMPYPAFDRSRLRIQSRSRRQHDLDLSVILPLDAPLPPFSHPALGRLGQRLAEARGRGSARILQMGAHVLRAGVARYLIDLMERGLLDHVAMNG